jgi:hypothetical protein
VTSDSHGAPRGYGPFSDGAEPPSRSGAGDDATAAFPSADHGGPGAVPPDGFHPTRTGHDQYGLDPASTSGGSERFGSSSRPAPGGLDQYGLDPAPNSGAPDRFGLDPTPHSGGPSPFNADPAPISGAPDRFGLDPAPHSGRPNPFNADPAPISGAPDRFGLDPAPAGDPYGFGSAVNRGPRIEPSPPPQRNRLIIGLIAGLLAGLVVFGAGGYFLGRSTGSAAPDPAPTAEPSAAPSLGVYEQSQLALNQAKLTGALAPISHAWLPHLSTCVRNGDPGGPSLNKGEKTRVRCRFDGMSVIFVEYPTVAERDKARVKTLSQNVDARTLTPGVGPAADRAAPSGRTTGSYVEYAYTVTENNRKQTVGGIWWDDAQTPVAGYMLAYWKDGVGESWAPMREVWTRYA